MRCKSRGFCADGVADRQTAGSGSPLAPAGGTIALNHQDDG
jgi:hypothetical protein